MPARVFNPWFRAALLATAAVALALHISTIGIIGWFHSDFVTYRTAGSIVSHGGSLYAHDFGTAYWTYPPFGALVMVPFGSLSLLAGRVLWMTLNLAALVYVVRVSFASVLERTALPRTDPKSLLDLVVVATALAPVADALALGQIGLILVALVIFDLRAIHSGRQWAGAFIGFAAAIKLIPLLFVPFLLLIRRGRATATAMFSFSFCWLVAWVAMPVDTRLYFSKRLMFRTADRLHGFGETVYNQSLLAVLRRWLPVSWVTALWLSASALVIIAALWAGRRYWNRQDIPGTAAVLGMATVLVTPVTWHHHAVWVVPALGSLLGNARRRSRVGLVAALALACMPASRLIGLTPFADWFLLCFLVCWVSLCANARYRSQVPA